MSRVANQIYRCRQNFGLLTLEVVGFVHKKSHDFGSWDMYQKLFGLRGGGVMRMNVEVSPWSYAKGSSLQHKVIGSGIWIPAQSHGHKWVCVQFLPSSPRKQRLKWEKV